MQYFAAFRRLANRCQVMPSRVLGQHVEDIEGSLNGSHRVRRGLRWLRVVESSWPSAAGYLDNLCLRLLLELLSANWQSHGGRLRHR